MNIVISAYKKSIFNNGQSLLNLDIDIPTGIHSLHWEGESGWIDYVNGTRQDIGGLPEWANKALAVYATQKDLENSDTLPVEIVGGYSSKPW